ncbi:MAG: L,D-transpeptidase [Anaerolineaceae bacterium]|jgi:lipoprotein-anchoring transpeptidase ErfK/SrfK
MKFTRRDFLKFSLLGLGLSAFAPYQEEDKVNPTHPRLMLVGNKNGVSIYKEPDERSAILYQRQYNEIINVYEEVIGPNGPAWNPIWYRCWGGYVFSGHLHEVRYEYNPLSRPNRASGQLAELTVPYSRSMYYQSPTGWEPLWMYYYGTNHWVTDVIEGPDGRPWYQVEDQLGRTKTAIPYEHLRFIDDAEFDPISPEVPPEAKFIDVSIPHQRMRAYEGDEIVFETKVSTGFPTGAGKYAIKTKMPSKHMGDAVLTSNIRERIWMGVPWTCFFELEIGLATHGTFWHSNFGTPMSAGCINMRNSDAKWVYRWSYPVAPPENWATHGWGTVIHVHT